MKLQYSTLSSLVPYRQYRRRVFHPSHFSNHATDCFLTQHVWFSCGDRYSLCKRITSSQSAKKDSCMMKCRIHPLVFIGTVLTLLPQCVVSSNLPSSPSVLDVDGPNNETIAGATELVTAVLTREEDSPRVVKQLSAESRNLKHKRARRPGYRHHHRAKNSHSSKSMSGGKGMTWSQMLEGSKLGFCYSLFNLFSS